MATLKDVAKEAGVSIATASRVLNNPDKVASKSRKKVLEVVERLGYSSNLMAKSLRQEKLNAIAVLLPNFSDPFFAQMHQGIADVLSSNGYLMISYSTEGIQTNELDLLSKVKSAGISGVLIYSPNRFEPDTSGAFYQKAWTVFLSGNNAKRISQVSEIDIDRKKIGSEAADYLQREGKNRVVYMIDSLKSIDMDYFAGLQETLMKKNGACEICVAGRSLEDAFRKLQNYSVKQNFSYNAVLTQYNTQAIGALSYFREKRIEVPESVALMSIGNTVLSRLTTPQITIIGPNGYQLGVLGTKYLLEKICGEGGSNGNKPGEVDTRLIIRGSTYAGDGIA
ncbi:LacI family transcriptional regulator [Caproiciproducens sp. NJN-50]|uniref:LacI family DNA-binding transcriptional regulator n=1 Tax=Acutalibacteraceae TaxID=3082771 RepID=UPI000FFDFF6B|nr:MULTISPECIES: LacI family DNA-binding transcriptional regulator [Acutalibacteraceae]QAT50050.1 LacI family transcriptional regulator [Caproiciproducens sp. NJN-50]